MVRRALAVLVGAAALALGACQLIAGLEAPSEIDRPAVEAAVEAGEAGTPPPPPGYLCGKGFPGPTGADDGAGARYTIAIRGFSFGTAGARVPAVDLDCADTRCDGGAPVATCTTLDPATTCDEPAGGDNQIAHLLGNNPFVSIDEQFGRAGIELGEFGELVQITNYNGLENDPIVNVAFVPSPGFEFAEATCVPVPSDAGAPDADAGDAGFPRWDGCDRWRQSEDYTFPSSTTARDFVPGYVRDSILYVEPREGTRAGVQLNGSVTVVSTFGMIARVERMQSSGAPAAPGERALRINLKGGLLFGRVPSGAVLDFISRFRTGTAKQCVDLTSFVLARKSLCASQDLPATPAGLNKACDAFSIAAEFEASPALSGSTAPTRQNEPCLRNLDGSVADSGLLECP